MSTDPTPSVAFRPPQERPDVHIVVLNWNGWKQTIACLESIKQQDYTPLSTIVVDNGSEDGSWDKLAAWQRSADRSPAESGDRSAQVQLLRSTSNLGFAQGCNFGIAKAISLGARYVLLLNNDARLGRSAVSCLVKVAIRWKAGIVGATLMDNHGRISRGTPKWPLRLFWNARTDSNIGRQGDSREVAEASGAAMLIDEALLESRIRAVGYALDPTFFMYGEDTDLCVYARAHQWRVIVARDAVVKHAGGGSSNGPGSCRSYYYITRNRVFLANRWLGLGQRVLFHIYYIPSRFALIGIRAIAKRPNCARAVLSGLFDAYRSVRGQWVHHGQWVPRDNRTV